MHLTFRGPIFIFFKRTSTPGSFATFEKRSLSLQAVRRKSRGLPIIFEPVRWESTMPPSFFWNSPLFSPRASFAHLLKPNGSFLRLCAIAHFFHHFHDVVKRRIFSHFLFHNVKTSKNKSRYFFDCQRPVLFFHSTYSLFYLSSLKAKFYRITL